MPGTCVLFHHESKSFRDTSLAEFCLDLIGHPSVMECLESDYLAAQHLLREIAKGKLVENGFG